MAAHPDASRRLHRMRVSEGFRTFVLDQFEELGEVTARPMFGGLGLYHGGLFFGIVARDVVYLKVDDTTRDDYLKAGMAPFTPYARRPGAMRYYAVPPEVLESPPELARWAKQAIAVAARAAQTTRGKR
jgi:DNA transformation protein and related proteins